MNATEGDAAVTSSVLEDYGQRVALDYAVRSRERHGVQLNGTCGYCRTIWPCFPFWIAHHVVMRLSQSSEDASSS